ncbi:AzlD domain-containing protein [Halanaerobacter jeridensis]|uniref:Branched-subunit amino acid transport protein n=1 Tax=Halanaerobacter jeridensis TaxID=706427 RepID=A0A938XYE7_9FIRM|nr:branched-subunit amino acid transport protein [Halanaerobacter jeridensis]
MKQLNNLILIIIGMAVVTYIPRLLPLALFSNLHLPPFFKRFLEFIPYTALSALIFPAILSATGSLGSAILGGIVAIALAYLEINLFLIVSSSIAGVLFWELLI